MVVDRLEDRLPVAKVAEVLSEDVEVVRRGLERRDSDLGPLLAVVAAVVVATDVGDAATIEDPTTPR